MSAADKIAESRALIEPSSEVRGPVIGKLQDAIAALTDLADAQAQENAKLRSALQSANAALNPICGHVKTGQVKRDRYLDGVRAKIAAALGDAP